MGYYVKVESNVKLYVRILTQRGRRQSCFCTGGLVVISCLNISLISFLKWDIDVLV